MKSNTHTCQFFCGLALALVFSVTGFSAQEPIAIWDFSSGTEADLTSTNGTYVLTRDGSVPTYNQGNISLSANSRLSTDDINTTDLPNLKTQATIWVRMKFDAVVPASAGMFFGLVNSDNGLADWGGMSLSSYVSDAGKLGQYSRTSEKEYGQATVQPPETGTWFTMALTFNSGHDQSGFNSTTLSQFVTYINGVQVISGSATGLTLQDCKSLSFGHLKSGWSGVAMSFDEVRIYDTALTAAEIATITPIPEPTTTILVVALTGFVVVGFIRRHRNISK